MGSRGGQGKEDTGGDHLVVVVVIVNLTGCEGRVFSLSAQSQKDGLTVLGLPVTPDSGYRLTQLRD